MRYNGQDREKESKPENLRTVELDRTKEMKTVQSVYIMMYI